MRRSGWILGLGLTAAVAVGQVPYGAGFATLPRQMPTLDSNGAWSGHSTHAFRVRGAPSSTFGGLALSTAAYGPSLFSPITIGVDPAELIAFLPMTSDAAGEATLPFPIPVLPSVNFAGASVFSQAAFSDPTLPFGFSFTRALASEVAAEPRVLVCSYSSLSSHKWFVLDPSTPTLSTVGTGSWPNPLPPAAAVFGAGERHAFVARTVYSPPNTIIDTVDMVTGTTSVAFVLPQYPIAALAYDPFNKTVWGYSEAANGTLAAISADPADPMFGTLQSLFTNLGTPQLTGMAIFPDRGRLFVVASAAPLMVELDIDPYSSTYGTKVAQHAIPFGPTMTGVYGVAGTTAGNGQLLLTIQGSAPNFSEIARFDVTVGAFIDHNPATPTIDAIGSMSSPPVAFTGSYASHIAVSGDGTHALVVGTYGTARLQSLTLDPRNPDAWGIATVNSSLGLGPILDVGFLPDPNLAVFTSHVNGRVTIFDVATDTIVATRTLASVTGDPLHLCLGR